MELQPPLYLPNTLIEQQIPFYSAEQLLSRFFHGYIRLNYVDNFKAPLQIFVNYLSLLSSDFLQTYTI